MQYIDAKNELAERSSDTSVAHKTRCGEWLNFTMQEMVSFSDSWDWLQKMGTLAIVTGVQEYTISSTIGTDVESVFDFRVETEGGWKLMTYSPSVYDALYPDPDLVSGRPEGFTVWSQKVLLDRSPDKNYTAQVRYYKSVANLVADGEIPPWPARWDHVWVWGALVYAYEFNDDIRSGSAAANFQRGLRQMLSKQSMFRPRIVVGASHPLGRPFGPQWPVNRYPW